MAVPVINIWDIKHTGIIDSIHNYSGFNFTAVDNGVGHFSFSVTYTPENFELLKVNRIMQITSLKIAGVIQVVSVRVDDKIIEVSGDSLEIMLTWRPVSSTYSPQVTNINNIGALVQSSLNPTSSTAPYQPNLDFLNVDLRLVVYNQYTETYNYTADTSGMNCLELLQEFSKYNHNYAHYPHFHIEETYASGVPIASGFRLIIKDRPRRGRLDSISIQASDRIYSINDRDRRNVVMTQLSQRFTHSSGNVTPTSVKKSGTPTGLDARVDCHGINNTVKISSATGTVVTDSELIMIKNNLDSYNNSKNPIPAEEEYECISRNMPEDYNLGDTFYYDDKDIGISWKLMYISEIQYVQTAYTFEKIYVIRSY